MTDLSESVGRLRAGERGMARRRAQRVTVDGNALRAVLEALERRTEALREAQEHMGALASHLDDECASHAVIIKGEVEDCECDACLTLLVAQDWLSRAALAETGPSGETE